MNIDLSKDRKPGLDLVRAIAILLVLFSHSFNMKIGGVSIGLFGIEIFFVLSGFLIGQILIVDFMNGVTWKGLFFFWFRRWMRTLPIYYLVILFKFIVIDHLIGSKIIVYFFFLQNNFVGIDFYPVSWSLVIEEWFYLILPVTMFIFFKKGIVARKEKFIYFLLFFIIFINIIRIAWVLYTDRGWGAIVGNFPFRLDSLLVGVLAAAVKILSPSFYRNIWLSKNIFIAGMFLFLALITAFAYVPPFLNIDLLFWKKTIWFFLFSFSISLMIPFVDNSFLQKKGFWIRSITWISLISYSLYLIHPLVYYYFPKTGFEAWDTIIKNAALFIVCSISYICIEKPFMDLRTTIAHKIHAHRSSH